MNYIEIIDLDFQDADVISSRVTEEGIRIIVRVPVRVEDLPKDQFGEREQQILLRIKSHYGQKLGRDIDDSEAKEIADNLLHFAQALYES